VSFIGISAVLGPSRRWKAVLGELSTVAYGWTLIQRSNWGRQPRLLVALSSGWPATTRWNFEAAKS
jgi:hypothetical protein